MAERPITEAWKRYRDQVLPADAGEVQLRETRRAFFAGAASLQLLLMMRISSGDEVTEADEALMVAVDKDLEEYVRSVGGPAEDVGEGPS